MSNFNESYLTKVKFFIFSIILLNFYIQSKPSVLALNSRSIGNLQEQVINVDLFPSKRLLSFDLAAFNLTDKASNSKNIQNKVTQQSKEQMLITGNQPNTNYSSIVDLENQVKKPIKPKHQNHSQYHLRYNRKVNLKTNLNKPYVYKPPTTLPLSPEAKAQLQREDKKSAMENNKIDSKMLKQAAGWKKMVGLEVDEINRLTIEQFEYYQKKYNISSYEELPFCIVVPTYNNKDKDRYLKNIKSIVMQNYSNYHIVVIDDASNDGTGDLINDFMDKQSMLPKERYWLIKNTQSKRAMFNLRRAAMEYCEGEQIFLVVDGDDELVGRQVLKLFSAYFQKYDAWFVYSNFIHGLKGDVGYSRAYPKAIKLENRYRSYPFMTSHLRAFYTQLFRNIKEQDLKDRNGDYFKAANDVAICIPALEQSHLHVMYLPEVTYFYSDNTGQNNHLIRAKEQRQNDQYVRTKPSYKSLKKLLDEN